MKLFHTMRKHLHCQPEVWVLMQVLHMLTIYRYLKLSITLCIIRDEFFHLKWIVKNWCPTFWLSLYSGYKLVFKHWNVKKSYAPFIPVHYGHNTWCFFLFLFSLLCRIILLQRLHTIIKWVIILSTKSWMNMVKWIGN